MKTSPAIPLTFLLVLVLTGCDPRRTDPTASGESSNSRAAAPAATEISAVPADAIQTSDPVAGALDEVKTLSYETRSSLSLITDKMDRQIDALMAQWVAAGRKFPQESEAQFRSARQASTGKLNALTSATPESWNTAKDEAATAFQNVRSALHAMDTSAK